MRTGRARLLAVLAVLAFAPNRTSARGLEPRPPCRSDSTFAAVNNVSWGDLTFDPSLPVED